MNSKGLRKLQSPVKTSSSKLGSVDHASVQMETVLIVHTHYFEHMGSCYRRNEALGCFVTFHP